MNGFFLSIRAYFQTLRLIPQLKLWRFIFLPALISLVVAAMMGGLAYFFGGSLGNWLVGFLPEAAGDGWLASIWNWILSNLQSAAGFMGGIISIAIGLVIYKNLVIVIVGPFLSPLSEKVEEHLTGIKSLPPPFFTTMIRSLRLASRNIIKELFWVILLFIFGLFPLFSIPSAILIFLVQSYYAGAGNLDLFLERHLKRRDSIRFIKDNRGMVIGNGMVFMLLLSLGIGFLLAPPLAAIAATLTGDRLLD